MKNEIADIQKELTSFETRWSAMDRNSGTSINETAVLERVDALEILVRKMIVSPSSTDGCTAVVGGLGNASSSEAAKEWLQETMKKASINEVLDMYHKGANGFNGWCS